MVSTFLNCEQALGAGEENGEKACSHVSGIGKFLIPRRSWTSTIERLMRVNFFAKTKPNKGNLPLSRWKTIEILKTERFQSLNFTSKPKGYLLQTIKLWEKLIVLKRRKLKSDEAKEEVNFLSLKRVKFVKMTLFYSF